MSRRSKIISKRKKKEEEEEEEEEESEEESEEEEERITQSDNDDDDDDNDSEEEEEEEEEEKNKTQKRKTQKYSTVPLAPKKQTRRKTRIESTSSEDDDENDDSEMSSESQSIGTQLGATKKRPRKANSDNESDEHISDSDNNNDDDDDEYNDDNDDDDKPIKKPTKKKSRQSTQPLPSSSSSHNNNTDDDNDERMRESEEEESEERYRFGDDLDVIEKETSTGIIQRVELENFMSHRHFAIDLGPNVNFIVGANGSGKSAILIALSVALGAKASFTQRGQSIKELITNGEQTARIRVTLSNTGGDAYCPDVFGDSITVERVIGSGGSNAYRLKDARGKTKKSGHAAVVSMLDHFGIVVDNPCVLLMQDTAKQFLWKQSPAAKYDFFMKATLLDTIMTEYRAVSQQCEASKAELESKMALLPDLEADVDALRSERGRAERLGHLAETVAELKNELAWAYVGEARQAHASAEARYRGAVARRGEIEAAGRKVEAQEADIKEEFSRQMALLDAKKREIDVHNQHTEQLRARKGDLFGEYNRVCADIKERNADIARKRKRLEIVQSNIRREREKMAAEASQSQTQADAQRAAAAQRKDAAEDELQAQRKRYSDSDEALRGQQVRAQQAKRRQDAAAAAVLDARRRVQGLAAQSKTRASALGARMPEFIQMVAEARRRGQFRNGVLGPIGMEIGLKDTRWATAVECVLKPPVLGMFVVFDHNDASLLRRMAGNLGMRLSMLIVPYAGKRYALADEPPPAVRTILRVLDIAEPDIANALVDHYHIHRIALVDNSTEGFAVLKGESAEFQDESQQPSSQYSSQARSRGKGGNLPVEAFTVEGDRLIVRNGNSAFYPHPRRARGNGGRVWFGVDYDAEIAATTRALEETLGPAAREAEGAVAAEQRRLKELELAHRGASEALRGAESAFRRAEAELRQLERAEQERRQPADFESMEQQGRAIEGEIEAIEGTLGERTARMEEVKAKIEENKREIQKCKAAGDDFAKEVLALKAQITPLQTSLQAVVDKRAHNRREFEAASVEAAHLAEEAQARLRDLEIATEKARKVCPEDPHPDDDDDDGGGGNGGGENARRSPKEIARDIEACARELEASRRKLRDVEEIDADLAKATHKLAKAQKSCEAIKGNEHELRHSLKIRGEKVRDMRETMSHRMKRLFANILEQRQCRGNLIINHSDHLIDMNVNFDQDSKLMTSSMTSSRSSSSSSSRSSSQSSSSTQGTNTKTLSGGERSYSTIAFLVALWEAVECPFCALDEFDVFMDSVNRKVAIDTLLKFAELYKHRQFIVITPQTDIELRDSNYVTIKRLKPPVRGVSSPTQSQI